MLLAQTPMQQVLRLPILIEHFREHQAENGSISLADFLILHYFSGNPKDADYDRDMQLPFRANDVVLVSSVLLPAQVEVDFAPPAYEEKNYSIFCTTDLTPLHPFDIFQPPRLS